MAKTTFIWVESPETQTLRQAISLFEMKQNFEQQEVSGDNITRILKMIMHDELLRDRVIEREKDVVAHGYDIKPLSEDEAEKASSLLNKAIDLLSYAQWNHIILEKGIAHKVYDFIADRWSVVSANDSSRANKMNFLTSKLDENYGVRNYANQLWSPERLVAEFATGS